MSYDNLNEDCGNSFFRPHPQSNPVNRLVKQMRDAGELTVQEFYREHAASVSDVVTRTLQR